MRETIADTPIRTISVVTMECIDQIDDTRFTSLSYGLEVTNYTSNVIVVATRDGLIHEIKPQRLPPGSQIGPGVVVRMAYKGKDKEVKLDAACLLNEPQTELHARLAAGYKRGINNWEASTSASLLLSSSVLKEHGGIVYLREVDLQISILDSYATPPHPFSPGGREYHTRVDNPLFESDTNMAFSLELIDNEGVISTKYLNHLGEVYAILPERNPHRSSGLYITKNGTATALGKRKELDVEHVPLDKVHERLGQLYTTAADAKALGNADAIQKRELEATEARLKREELELKTRKAELDKEILETKRELELEAAKLNRAKNLYEEEKLGREQLRGEWEERKVRNAQTRKESVEILKMIPVVMSFVVTVMAFYKKT